MPCIEMRNMESLGRTPSVEVVEACYRVDLLEQYLGKIARYREAYIEATR